MSSLTGEMWQYESWMTSHDPDFWAKAGDVCGLYVNPPVNAGVWSVDEKTGMLLDVGSSVPRLVTISFP
jgi:hypothetical protein